MNAPRLAAATLIVALCPGAAAAQVESDPVLVDSIAAVVNNAIVLNREVDARVALYVAAGIGMPDDKTRKTALDSLIEEELIGQAAFVVGLSIADGDVTNAITQIMQANGISDDQLLVALGEQGYTMASYRESIRRELVRYRMVAYVVQPAVQISDQHVKEAYDHLKGLEGDKIGEFADVEDAIRNQLYEEATTNGTQQWLDQLRHEAYIELR
jgi:peptidyl-prolyl cis-trans isomerase SurA